MRVEIVADKKSKNFATFVSNENKKKLNASRSKENEKALWLLMILICLIFPELKFCFCPVIVNGIIVYCCGMISREN